MATDVILTLTELRCVREDDGSGGSEPYLWPAMVYIDEGVPGLVGSSTRALGDARRAVASGMRAGQTAAIANGTLRYRRDESQMFHGLIVVVALWEEDETPLHAVEAGFQAFASELPAAIADNLAAIKDANEQELEQIEAEIAARVRAKIASAIEDDLTAAEKFEVWLGTLDLDDFVANAFDSSRTLQSRALTFSLSNGSSEEYVVAGQLQVQPVPIDPCQRQFDAVVAARAAVNDINAEIKLLQDELKGKTPNGEPPRPKAEINREIRRLRTEELPPARRALEAAEESLRQCRLDPPLNGHVGGGVLVAER